MKSLNIIFSLLLMTTVVSAETVVLKTGEKIDGKLVEKNDKYVKIDFKGAVIAYHTFEIESVDGKAVSEIKNDSSDETLQVILKSTDAPKELIANDAVTPEDYLGRGFVFYSKGEFDLAISNLDKAIKAKPEYAEAYLYRGLSCMGKKNSDQAISDYNKVIEINPKNEEAYFVRGVAYADKQDIDKAISDYNKAIEINPKYVQAYLNRAFINMAKGNVEQAISDANKVLDTNPGIAVGYYVRALAYGSGNNLRQAISDYGKAIAINPKYAEAYVNRALARAYTIAELAKADTNSPAAYVNIGISLLDKAGFEQAVSDCTKAIEINPKYLEAYIVRARIYILANDFDKAWADIHKVEELGGTIRPEFLEALRKASGREK